MFFILNGCDSLNPFRRAQNLKTTFHPIQLSIVFYRAKLRFCLFVKFYFLLLSNSKFVRSHQNERREGPHSDSHTRTLNVKRGKCGYKLIKDKSRHFSKDLELRTIVVT